MSRQNQMSSVARARRNRLHDRVEARALCGEARGDDHQAAEPTGSGLTVNDLHAPRMSPLCDQAGRFAGALTRARQPAGDMDGEHIPTLADERLVALQEVPRRGL